MITFKSVSTQNFQSFGNTPTNFVLNTQEITLILGTNKDVGAEGYSRNGVGKSTIFEAITWCLFNEAISYVKQDSLINIFNKKKMFVEMDVDFNGTELHIKRGRKPNIIEITKDGEPYTLHSVGNNDDAIIKLMGMDRELFLNTVILSSDSNTFMKMKPAPQRDFMENVLSLNILTERALRLKSMKKENDIEIRIEEQNKINIENNIETQRRDIIRDKASEAEFEGEREDKLHTLKSELDDLESIDLVEVEIENKQYEVAINSINDLRDSKEKLMGEKSEKEKALAEKESLFNSELQDLRTEHNKSVSSVKDDYNLKLKDLNKNLLDSRNETEEVKKLGLKVIENSRQELTELTTFINKRANDLEKICDVKEKLQSESDSMKLGKCFYCEQNFTSETKKKELAAHLTEADNSEKELMKELTDIVDKEKVMKAAFESEKEKIESVSSNSLKTTESNYKVSCDLAAQVMDDDIDSLLSQLNDRSIDVEMKFKLNIDSLKVMITEIETKLKGVDKEINNLNAIPKPDVSSEQIKFIIEQIKQRKKMIEDKKEEVNPYTAQKIKREENLTVYDESVLAHMRSLETHYKVLIKLLTDNKSFVRRNLIDQYIPFINQKINATLEQLDSQHRVRINNDLSVDIEYMKSIMSYGNLSKGERLRLDLSTSLAFRELLAISGSNCNLLCIDELLDSGGDTNFFHKVFNLINARKDDSVFIISHREELISEVDTVINIIKTGGFTTIT